MDDDSTKQSERSCNRRTLSRRRSLGLIGTALTVGVAGCTDGSGDSDGSGSTPGDGSSDGTGTPSGEKQEIMDQFDIELVDYADQVEDELTIFQWSAYWPTYFIPNFEELYGVDVSVSFIDSNEGMLNKRRSLGPGQVDIMFPSDFMVNIMASQDLLQPLELDKIPNYGNLLDSFEEVAYEPDDMSGTFSNPYNWGWSAMGNNKDVTGRSLEPTWDEMWNEDYAGNITMLNNQRETIGAALLRLGYSVNTTDEDKIEEAKELLIQQKELVQSYDSSNVQSMITNEEVSPAHGWNGQVFGAYRDLMDDDNEAPVEFVIPEEGNIIWTDAAVLDKEAPNPNAAHAFMNYMNNLKVHADLTNWLIYPNIMENEREHRADEWVFEKLDGFSPTEEQLGRMEYIENVGEDTKLFSDAWTEIKNA